MKKETIVKLQEKLMKISVNSIGRSVPAGVYEREIPEAVLKMKTKKEIK